MTQFYDSLLTWIIPRRVRKAFKQSKKHKLIFSFGAFSFLVLLLGLLPISNEISEPVKPEEATSAKMMMLPGDLPWAGSTLNGQTVILQPGISFISCGTTVGVSTAERYTIGLVDISSAVPGSGRSEVTGTTDVWHHPDWTIDKIGNIYGIAINKKTGDMFAAASANYGSGYFGQSAVVGYGSIGGGINDLSAAGTVYKIDAVTGAPTVFSVLPQQSSTFTMQDCETSDIASRTTGVGLGNIAYDEDNDQYFVSNMEDGRIYRIDNTGAILDSYDPGIYDDGVAGISNVEDLAYGIVKEPGTDRLFYGAIDSAPGTGAQAGSPGIYSIDLTASGGFSGTVDNTFLHAGATYDNFIGTETLHTTIPTGGGASFANDYMYFISSLDFSFDGELLAGVRVGCKGTYFSSYNHWGEINIISKNAGTGLYSDNITEFDISFFGDAGPDDSYGGVGYYLVNDGSGSVQYAISSGDILDEEGPHGIAVFSTESFGSPVSPLGAISYGLTDDLGNGDPKGVGGDVLVFSGCIIDYISLTPTDCSTGTYTLNGEVVFTSPPNPLGLITITVDNNGTPVSVQIDPSVTTTFSIPGLSCDSDTGVEVTATFDNQTGCTITDSFDEPAAPPCSLDIAVTSVSSCSNGTYTVDGTISALNAPSGGITLTLTESSTTQTLNLAGNATSFQFTGLTCDGDNNIQINASFDNLTACADTESYDEPCFLDITAVNVTDNCLTNGTYNIEIVYTVYNAPGNLELSGNFPGSPITVSLASGADVVNGTESVTGISCGTTTGAMDNVAGSFPGDPGCSDIEPYTIPLLGASLGDTVFEDLDADGIQDPGEPGVEGATVSLFTCLNGVKDQPVPGAVVTTNASGYYQFTGLAPGDYCVQFDASTSNDPDAAEFVFTVQNSTASGADDTNDSDVDPNTGNSQCINLVAGEDDPTIDAGVYIPASLGDTVFEDVDGDGIQDPGEPGVEGATVTLYTCLNGVKDQQVPGAVVTTNASGFYEFTGLVPGDYCVQFDASTSNDPDAAEFVFTVQNSTASGADDTNDSDVDPNTSNSSCINLESGEDDPTIDAGVYVPASLGDTVFEDEDGDGIQDPGEPGVEGATVTLYTCLNGVKDQPVPGAVVTTNGSGFYEFTGLAPGDYCVQFDASTSNDPDAANFVFTVQNSTAPGADDTNDSDINPNTGDSPCVNLESGEDDPTIDAGVYVPASIGDTVFEDVDADGIQDPGEPGVEGATVTLFTCVNGVKDQPVPGAVVTTNSSGFYEFTGLVPGDYCVQFDASTSNDPDAANFTFTVQNSTAPGADDTNDSDVDPNTGNSSCINLESGEDDPTVDAGVYVPASLGDTVFEDINANGIQDPSEPGVEGATVTLYSCVNGIKDQPVQGAVTTTTSSGFYEFTGLVPGDYCVQFDPSTSTSPDAANFLFTIQDSNEPGADDTNDSDVNPNTGNSPCVNLESGENDPTIDAGVYAPATIGDQVFEDIDGDGVQDPGEPPVEGVTVTLYTCVNGVKDQPVPGAVITTNSSGFYEFTGLVPGDYCVQFDASTSSDPEAAAFEFTIQDSNEPGANDSNDSDVDGLGNSSCINLVSGEEDPTVDAGVYVPATLGDTVWEDINGDGVQDPGEPGVEGVTATLFTCVNGVKDQPVPGAVQSTSATGFYEFTGLAPGDYCVQFDPTTSTDPAANEFVFTIQDAQIVGADDTNDSDVDNQGASGCINLESREEDPTVDAGVYEPASEGDFVWEDLNANGIQDPGEPGIPGVTISLFYCVNGVKGSPVPGFSTTTDPAGGYSLTGIPPGTYCVQFDMSTATVPNPGDLVITIQDSPLPGANDDNDSDIDPNTGNTTCFTLISGDDFPQFDAGAYFPVSLGDYVWEDNNGNGEQDDGPTGVEDVVVTLTGTDGTGAAVGPLTMTTDGNGLYLFDDLVPGDYCVSFDISNIPDAGIYIFTVDDIENNTVDTEDSDVESEQDQVCTTLVSGDQDLTLDAGIYPDTDGDLVPDPIDPNPGEADPNGYIYCVASGEIIPGGAISVSGPGPVLVMNDGSSGFYGFIAVSVSGVYTINFTPPTGYILNPACLDEGGVFAPGPGITTLGSGEDGLNPGFMENGACAANPYYYQIDLQPGVFVFNNNFPLDCASLGDYVWEDANFNGQQDPGEPILENASVTLTGIDANGNPVNGVTATDPTGFYEFTGLSSGDYCVSFDPTTSTHPFNLWLKATEQDEGSDLTDSDISQGTFDVCTNLSPGEDDPTLDAGFVIACPPPINMTVPAVTTTTATLEWQSQNLPIIDHCWNIEVYAATGQCDAGQSVVSMTVCTFTPGLTWDPVTGIVTYTVTGLAPGTDYAWSLVETCDGDDGNSGFCFYALGPPFTTFDDPFIVSGVGTKPACPFASPGYVADGSFEVTIQDGVSCPGTTYDITIIPVVNSGPGGSTPPVPVPNFVLGATAAGSPYFFGLAGAGDYTVSVLETGPCNQMTNPEVITVNVPDGMDMEDPIWQIADVLGNVLVDNNPLTPAGSVLNMGTIVMPEGSCSSQLELYASGLDLCDGIISAANALSLVSNTTVPGTVQPGTQVEITPDGFGVYLIDINWSVGTTTLVFDMTDASGNNPDLTLIATLEDNTNPVLTMTGLSNVTIPVCSPERELTFTVTVDDLCDQDATEPNVTLNGVTINGGVQVSPNVWQYTITVDITNDGDIVAASYTDGSGNVGSTQITLDIEQAAADLPPVVDIPGNLNYHIPACEPTVFALMGFQVSDDCTPIDPNLFTFTDGTGGFNLVAPLVVQNNPYTAYIEFSGNIDPGVYPASASYDGGAPIDFTINVTQNAATSAEIIMPGNLNFTIPTCAAELESTFSISILDDCDDPINGANANFWIQCGGNPPLAINPILQLGGYFEFLETFTGNLNGCLLFAEYTNGNNLVTTVNTLLTITAQEDNWPPVVLYPSNAINVELDPCDVGGVAIVPFEVTATDDCSGDLTPQVTIVPAPIDLVITDTPGGDTYTAELLPGNYNVLIEAVDGAGNTTTENFNIVITQAPPPVANLNCNDDINVTLNADCQVVIVPDMLLEGNFGCLTDADFQIIIQDGDPSNGNIVDGCGDFIYEITLAAGVLADPGDFTTCWGYIHAEDKTDPIIECPDNTNQATVEQEFQEIPGALDATDGTFQPGLYSCWLEFFNPQLGDHYYEACTFTVTQDDVYTFDLYAPGSAPGVDWMGGLFQNGFSEADPCENIISQNDLQAFGLGFGFYTDPFTLFFQDDGEPIWRVTLPLKAGSSYTLVTTSMQAGAQGNFVWRAFSDGDGELVGNCVTPVQTTNEIKELICDDIDHIYIDNLDAAIPRCYRTDRAGNVIFPPNFLERQRIEALLGWLGRTGLPTVSDNCGNLEVCVEDVVTENGDCGEVTITRTFSVKDKQGNYITNSPCDGQPNTAACVQIITFRKPVLQDIVLPPYTVFLECDEGFDTDANGNPHPNSSGYPFVITAFGIHDLDQTYCNLGASYSDYPRVEICESTYKVRREWNIFDWCNPGQNYTYNQTIKVGDFSIPEITCPIVDWDQDGVPDHVLTYSTGPFDCTATFAVPAPVITDNCSSTVRVYTSIITYVTNPVLDIYGNPIPGQTVTEELVLIELPEVELNLASPASTVGYVSDIPLGCHYFRYRVVDACDKEAIEECLFYVEDQVEPVAICDDDLNVSIGGEGYARVYATDIDEGSWDNCGPIRLEVRRLYNEDPETCEAVAPFYSPWSEYVDFNCCDVHDNVTIEMRVWDDRNGDGIPGNTIPVLGCDGTTQLVEDNYNTCWLEVLVEDKVNPECIAPHDVAVDCTDIPYDFDPFDTDQLQELFGEAEGTDNCPAVTIDELTPIVNLHDCGFGTIIRRFRALDEWGNVSTNSCQQVISIREVHNYEIGFPKDAQANCGDPNPDTILTTELACDLLAVSVTDEEFSASGDECYKIFRTYRVINWCEYDGQSDPVVVGRDEDCDGLPGDEAVWVLVRPIAGTSGQTTVYYDRDQDENNLNPIQFTKSPTCDGFTNPTGYWIDSNTNPSIASIGYWQYTQVIKVYDNIDPIITPGAFDPFCSLDNVDCDGPIDIPFSVDENCTPDDVTVKVFLDAFGDGAIDYTVIIDNNGNISGDTGVFTVSGSYPNYNITSAGIAIGAHIFDVHVEDGCGNVGATLIPFDVVDCKAPVPTCINGLAIELMPTEPGTDADGDGDEDTGAMAVWAIDFIASPTTDCSEPIKYSINRAGDTPDVNQTGIVLTCDDEGTLIIEIYAWDSAFNPYAVQPDGTVGGPNYDFCETYILVQDNMFDVCNEGVGNGSIAGSIMTEDLESVEGVDVQLSGNTAMNDLTETDGTYEFLNIPLEDDISVTAYLDQNHLNGVSTFDLVLITKHILGIQHLNSPYKIIAADINNSQSVTTLDLIHCRKVILAVEDEFPNNTSWRFVDASYVFPNPANPWEEYFPEVISINNLPGDLTNEDFIGVKIGDVNSNAIANSFTEVDERNSGDVFTFDLEDVVVRRGNEYTVSFTASEMVKIQGYQLTLNFDAVALSLANIEYGVNQEENFGLRYADEGNITMSWNRSTVNPDEVLFSLVFEANADAQMSELLSVNSRYTPAEAYNTSGELMEVGLNFNNGTMATARFELYQNQPNPFKGKTLIGFNLPEATEATIKIHDANGRILKLIRDGFAKGYNAISVNSSELLAVGVLYYTVETADYTATKKMILME